MVLEGTLEEKKHKNVFCVKTLLSTKHMNIYHPLHASFFECYFLNLLARFGSFSWFKFVNYGLVISLVWICLFEF